MSGKDEIELRKVEPPEELMSDQRSEQSLAEELDQVRLASLALREQSQNLAGRLSRVQQKISMTLRTPLPEYEPEEQSAAGPDVSF